MARLNCKRPNNFWSALPGNLCTVNERAFSFSRESGSGICTTLSKREEDGLGLSPNTLLRESDRTTR
jgi:hypothetical protein